MDQVDQIDDVGMGQNSQSPTRCMPQSAPLSSPNMWLPWFGNEMVSPIQCTGARFGRELFRWVADTVAEI